MLSSKSRAELHTSEGGHSGVASSVLHWGLLRVTCVSSGSAELSHSSSFTSPPSLRGPGASCATIVPSHQAAELLRDALQPELLRSGLTQASPYCGAGSVGTMERKGYTNKEWF